MFSLLELAFLPVAGLHCKDKKYRNFETNIPRKGISRPQSQFSHSCVCEQFIYSHDWSAYFCCRKIYMWTNPGNIAHRQMNVEIGTQASHFLFWEHIILIFIEECAIYTAFHLSKIHCLTGFYIEIQTKAKRLQNFFTNFFFEKFRCYTKKTQKLVYVPLEGRKRKAELNPDRILSFKKICNGG
jgi:hypothetical protein